jgi:putative hydroxymethylpyrimidine transport system substrate-binding protein
MRNSIPIKLGGWILVILATGALLGGCGGNGESKSERSTTEDAAPVRAETPPAPKCPSRSGRMQVALDGRVAPESLGILMAQRLGYFTDAGLQVRVEEPRNPVDPIPSVGTGDANLGVAPQPRIIIARDEGTLVIGLGSLVSEPTEAIIWLRGSGIEKVADLKGKTIAYPGLKFQRLFLERILARAGLGLDDVKLKRVGYHLAPVLASGKADAIFGGSWNLEGAELRARGQRPVISKVKNLAIAGYDQSVLVAPFECVYKRPGLFRRFLAAVARGAAAAVKDPAGAARAIKATVGSEPGTGRGVLDAQVKATLPLLSRDLFLSPQRIFLINWMKNAGMLREKWPYATIFTNYYLE